MIELFPFDFGVFTSFDSLDATAQVTELAEMLAEFGVELSRPWTLPMGERGGDAVDERFASWGTGQQPTVLYWVGHGWATAQQAALAHARSPRRVGTKGVDPASMAAAISEWEATAPEHTWLLVIIDACKSARFAERLAAELDDLGGPRRIAILGASTASSTTLGAFTRELAVALRHTFAGNATIPITQLVDELRRTVRGARRVLNLGPEAVLERVVPPVSGFAGPLDARAELAAIVRDLPEDERRHFLTKAQGGEVGGDGAMLGELTWHFTGRDEERHEVLSRLGSGDMVVVTGRAGSGKSAILGDLVVRSRPALAKVLMAHDLLEPTFDPLPRFDASIHLTGLDTTGVLTRISDSLGLSAPGSALPISARLDDLTGQLHTRTDRARILVDALDEAADPLQLAAVLRRIGASPGVELVVGTRPSTREGPDLPDPDDRDLLDALGVTEEAAIQVRRNTHLAFRYVRDRLHPLVADGRLGQERADAVARTIAAVDQEFLYARLATYEILARPELAGESDLIGALGADHRSIFAGAVARLARMHSAYRPLLTALALAQGRGLPILDGVWAAVASAVSGRSVGEAAIHLLLEAAAPFLALDVDHGQTVYRLAHRTFAEHLTAEPGRTGERHRAIVTRAIAELAELVEHGEAANAYWTAYTSAHCAAAGRSAWEELDRSPVLDLLDPVTVAGDAMRSLFGRGPMPTGIGAGVLASRNLAGAPAAARRQLRRLATARLTGSVAPPTADDDLGWSVRWARMDARPVHATLRGHQATVLAMTQIDFPGRAPLLASADMNGVIIVWDPATGTPHGEPMQGAFGPVPALACARLPDGRMLLASGEARGTIRLWNPLNGQPYGEPMTCPGVLYALVALPTRDGTLLAAGGSDGLIRIWDPATQREVGPALDHGGEVGALAALILRDGSTAIACAGETGSVRLWDVRHGTELAPLGSDTGPVSLLTGMPGPDGSTSLITVDDVGVLRLWDPGEVRVNQQLALGTGVGPLTALAVHPPRQVALGGLQTGCLVLDITAETSHAVSNDSVRAVAWVIPSQSAQSGSPLMLATGGLTGDIHLWAPDTGAAAVETGFITGLAILPGSRRIVVSTWTGWGTMDVATGDGVLDRPSADDPMGGLMALASFALSDGSALLVAVDVFGAVCLLDLTTLELVARSGARHAERVVELTGLSTPAGPVIASGSSDGDVRLWRSDLSPIGEPIPHRGLAGLAPVRLPDGSTALATVDDDTTIRFWDPATGRQVREPNTTHSHVVGSPVVVPMPDGSALLAIGREGWVTLSDLVTGREESRRLPGHAGWSVQVAAVQGTSGSVLLATADENGVVRLWDANRRCVMTIPLAGQVTAMISPDPTQLAVGLIDGLVLLGLGARPGS